MSKDKNAVNDAGEMDWESDEWAEITEEDIQEARTPQPNLAKLPDDHPSLKVDRKPINAPVKKVAKKEVKPDPNEPFAGVDAMSAEQIALGSVKVLEVSGDAGKSWVQIEVDKFHFHHDAIEADVIRTGFYNKLDPKAVWLARYIVRGRVSAQIYEGYIKQYKISDSKIRLRVYKKKAKG